MENQISNYIMQAAETLEKLADSHGVARAKNIFMLSQLLVSVSAEAGDMMKELDELRKFKEEHSEHDDQRNEVSAES